MKIEGKEETRYCENEQRCKKKMAGRKREKN